MPNSFEISKYSITI